jgi:hypothetical protein
MGAVASTSDSLDDQRDTLAYADAHRAKRKAAIGPFQLVQRGRDQTRA